MTFDNKELIDKYNEMLINFCEEKILHELPDDAIGAVNIIISAYMSAMMNIIFSIAQHTDDNDFIAFIDNINRSCAAAIPNGHLLVKTHH